jgi:shikimate kinase
MKIALIGMMGSGKTELGRLLAASFGVDFFDLDHLIEERSRMKIAEMFRDFGEEHFRDLEGSTLRVVAEGDAPMVLGCGGGVVLRDSSRLVLKERFITVWLDVPLSELLRRLSKEREHRPLLLSDTWETDLKGIFRQREEFYRQTAAIHYRWQQDQPPEESARIIENLIDAERAESHQPEARRPAL